MLIMAVSPRCSAEFVKLHVRIGISNKVILSLLAHKHSVALPPSRLDDCEHWRVTEVVH